jgi:methylase of polypeptide subunit release factors
MSRRAAGRPPSAGDLHRAWLELVDTDGPFLAVPALARVYGQGIPQPDADAVAALKEAKPRFEKAWEAWDRRRDDAAALDRYRAARDTWVDVVLRDVLGWGDLYSAAASGAAVRSPDHAVTVAVTGTLAHGGSVGAVVLVVDPVDSLRDPLADGWATSPIDRMEELLRIGRVPVGVVTDGRWWAIVSARPETMVASGLVDAQTWVEEPPTRNAFIELLSRRRLLAGRPEDRLTEMFGASVAAAEEITEALGVQVRRAVELLVQALSEAALDAVDRGERDPLPAARPKVYEAAVTVMMRVVFLLFAEERGLLPQGRLFTAGYGISEELDALDRRARTEGSEALDATHLTWHRLLATSLALYRGASFEDLRLPSYGGSLFDPDRFTFLTARSERGPLSVTVSDRVMLEVLRAVQVAQLKGQPARQISFRDIDVEQIGYIYEGLLGYSCADVGEVTVCLIGKPGQEPELSLANLEALAEAHPDAAKRADAILATVKESQPAAKPESKSALAKAIRTNDQIEDAERALRAVTTDAALRDRLRPFVGIIRRDLRDRPLVVQPGGLVVVETPSRATAGAHYTPRSLAEEVVRYALEPLVFDPGPHDKPDSADWAPLSSDRLLDLKIADIACGSGAFLVAAARYLAARLVEAWHRENAATGTPHELYTQAIRKVVATCLYGADINAMAVEMCKLSLWLVSLDPKLPFSFVDDKVLHGNSLLGLTDVRQLQYQHINPDAARGQMMLSALDVDGVLARAVSLRRRLATEVDDADPQRSATTKRRQWREYQLLTKKLTSVADGVVAAGLRLGGKPGRALTEAYQNLQVAVGQAYSGGGAEPDRTMLDGILDVGLTPTVQTDYERWRPLHWILAVPDVMERGGFDAVIGNPPFLGAPKIPIAVGKELHDWIANSLASGEKKKADLVAFFFLQAYRLTRPAGALGLIATGSIAVGDTREVGLDRLCSAGMTIMRAKRNEKWPRSTAATYYSAVWGSLRSIDHAIPRSADGVKVAHITTQLEGGHDSDEMPRTLQENLRTAFIGVYVLGSGFVLDPAARHKLQVSGSAVVVRPYLTGDDVNTQPSVSATSWIIDFGDKSEEESRKYESAYSHALRFVKPERDKVNRAAYKKKWWQFADKKLGPRAALDNMTECLVIRQSSNTLMPVRVSSRQVIDKTLVVFVTDSFAQQAILSSSVHVLWALKYGPPTQGQGRRYTPTDVFETFPRPAETERLIDVGKALDVDRREVMRRCDVGLTELYDLVNSTDVPESVASEVEHLRQLHVDIDEAIMAAYGWDSVPLDHGVHSYQRKQRWMVSPGARVKILDRLLEENHRRVAAQGEAPPPAEADETEGEGE